MKLNSKYSKTEDITSRKCLICNQNQSNLEGAIVTVKRSREVLFFINFVLDLESIRSAYSSSLLDKTAIRTRREFKDLLPDAPPDALDLLKNLLQFNPDKRLSAEEALLHPYIAKFHNPSEEIMLTYDVIPPVDDDIQLSVAEYRTKLYEVWFHLVFPFSISICWIFRALILHE